MRFGSPVLVTRGSLNRNPSFGPGFGREVQGTLIGARGNQVLVRLEQNDPNASVGPFHKGETGWWSRSAVNQR